MLRIVLTALIVCASTAYATAQNNTFDQSDGNWDYAGRSPIAGNASGWLVERFAVDHHLGGLADIVEFNVVLQDWNCTTLESTQIIIYDEFVNPTTQAPTGSPDGNAIVAGTAVFQTPGCGANPAGSGLAWIYTITPPTPLAGPFANDQFLGALVNANAQWPNDGLSLQFSSVDAPPAGTTINPEFPNSLVTTNLYPPANPGEFPGASYAAAFDTTSGGGTSGTRYPGSLRIWALEIVTSGSYIKAGSRDTTGTLYATNSAVAPDNFGMAGAFPDAINSSATQPARADSPIYRVGHVFPSGFTLVLLSINTSRNAIGQPIPIPNVGSLELDATDSVFQTMIGGTAGALGLQAAIAGPTTDVFLDIDALGVRNFIRPGLNLYGQALDLDLAAGRAMLSNLFRVSYQ